MDEGGEACGSTTSTQGWWCSLPVQGMFGENDGEMESGSGTMMM
jgi:hypothetical protein